ncbi:MAG: HEAT repeat domain-containing protein [Deltaproteobacteria bacterium]|nr:HEAT repeat domain-containing protein [Deltaproteobacteria bacterium]
MADARKLSLKELKEIVTDAEELSKGTRIVDDKGLEHLARHESKLFADAKGSGASPYKVQVTVEDTVKARCSCMAARSRPYCKHAAALLVAWSRAPEGFVVSEAPPPGAAGEAKKREVKKGKTDDASLMKHGVEQVATLVRELSVAGVATLAADRVEQVRGLADSLRESKLRRLSARTLELTGVLGGAARQAGFEAVPYADLMADLLLTVRKLEKHLAGETLEDKYVEELIGKTWTKRDRKPIADLKLVEYAFNARTTADGFVIRESRFVDLASGEHYSEKQIIPGFLASRTPAKKSWAGKVLSDSSGSVYPGFSPRRLDLEPPEGAELLDAGSMNELIAKCLPNVDAALAAFQDRRKDVFAPDLLPVALAVDTVLAEGARLQVAGAGDAALFLPDDPQALEWLGRTLRGVKLRALIGDVALDGALPTLFPLAAIVDGPLGAELVPFDGQDAAAVIASRKVRAVKTPGANAQRSAWADVARALGASTAAIALGEVREELAEALVVGLAALNARLIDPLAARLRELGLGKQAELLASAAAKPEPAERLDDFIKLYQVLGIALTRLAGASHVDRAALEPVPTFESVHVRKTERALEPREVAALAGQGKLNRYQAAVHYARYYAGIPSAELAASLYPTWADGSASPYVARALADKGDVAIAAAKGALGVDTLSNVPAWRRPQARVTKLTAIRVLEAMATPEAERVLEQIVAGKSYDSTLRSHAHRGLRALRLARGKLAPPPPNGGDVATLMERAVQASTKDERINAIRQLADQGAVEAIPYLRASFGGDVSGSVREAAAYALAEVGDVESVDTFVAMVRNRANDDEQAKIGAYALGKLGDVRGIEALLEAWAEGWKPVIVADAMRQIGTAALEPLVTLVEQQPQLADRKAALNVVAALPASDAIALFTERLQALADDPRFVERASLYLALAKDQANVAAEVARAVVSLRPSLADKGASKEEKALLRKCQKLT